MPSQHAAASASAHQTLLLMIASSRPRESGQDCRRVAYWLLGKPPWRPLQLHLELLMLRPDSALISCVTLPTRAAITGPPSPCRIGKRGGAASASPERCAIHRASRGGSSPFLILFSRDAPRQFAPLRFARLQFGLGLRVGEVVRLRCCDIDEERSILTIRETKFSKTRLVPMGPRLASRLSTFLALRVAEVGYLSPQDPVFSFVAGRPINPCTISATFHALVPKLGLVIPEGTESPTAHHLRHSFAVGRLLRWYRDNGNPADNLMKLSSTSE
jgi:Phage integrase family